jgi:hypothetical protein
MGVFGDGFEVEDAGFVVGFGELMEGFGEGFCGGGIAAELGGEEEGAGEEEVVGVIAFGGEGKVGREELGEEGGIEGEADEHAEGVFSFFGGDEDGIGVVGKNGEVGREDVVFGGGVMELMKCREEGEDLGMTVRLDDHDCLFIGLECCLQQTDAFGAAAHERELEDFFRREPAVLGGLCELELNGGFRGELEMEEVERVFGIRELAVESLEKAGRIDRDAGLFLYFPEDSLEGGFAGFQFAARRGGPSATLMGLGRPFER